MEVIVDSPGEGAADAQESVGSDEPVGTPPFDDRSRIKMTMEKVDGRWLASKVQLL